MKKSQERKIYEERYNLLNGERGEYFWLCVYCGLPADTRDHFPPISRVSDYEAMNLEHEIYFKVPSCRECNCLASDVLDETIVSRLERVKDALAKRYRRFLKPTEDWSDAELRSMGPNLRSWILKVGRVEYYTGIDRVMDQIAAIYEIE